MTNSEHIHQNFNIQKENEPSKQSERLLRLSPVRTRISIASVTLVRLSPFFDRKPIAPINVVKAKLLLNVYILEIALRAITKPRTTFLSNWPKIFILSIESKDQYLKFCQQHSIRPSITFQMKQKLGKTDELYSSYMKNTHKALVAALV